MTGRYTLRTLYKFSELATKRDTSTLLERFRMTLIASRGDKKSVKKFEDTLNGPKG